MSDDCISGGYVLQPRKLDESDIMREPPIVRELWQYLVRKVSHRDDEQHQRGTGVFKIRGIMDDLCWYSGYRKETYPASRVSKALKRLKDKGRIEVERTTRGLLVTVSNYGRYQAPENYNSRKPEMVSEVRHKAKVEQEKREHETPQQQKLRSSIYSNKAKLKQLTGIIDDSFDLIAEQCIAHYKNRRINVNPYATAIGWFKNEWGQKKHEMSTTAKGFEVFETIERACHGEVDRQGNNCGAEAALLIAP